MQQLPEMPSRGDTAAADSTADSLLLTGVRLPTGRTVDVRLRKDADATISESNASTAATGANREASDAAAAAQRSAAGRDTKTWEPERSDDAKDDLHIKAEHLRKSGLGLGEMVTVVIHTRNGEREQRNLEVLYLPKLMEAVKNTPPDQFPNQSSPTTHVLPPGRLPFRRWRWELWHGATLVAAGWRLSRPQAGRALRASASEFGHRLFGLEGPPKEHADGRDFRPGAAERLAIGSITCVLVPRALELPAPATSPS